MSVEAIETKVTKKDITSILKTINKSIKSDVVNICSDVEEDLKTRFIPTRSLKLNKVLYGGIPRGKITEVYGPTGSGKTTFCYELIGEDMTQDENSYWAWYETEGSFDPEVAESYGVDQDRLIYWDMTDDGAEKGLDVLEAIIRRAEELNLKGVIVNSVAGLTPKKELETLMEKQDMGVQAKMMSKLMRKITAITSKNKVAVVFINQIRDKISLFGGTTTTGKLA